MKNNFEDNHEISKKVKVYIESHIHDLLLKDVVDFGFKKNTLINKIIKECCDQINIKYEIKKEANNKPLTFDLTVGNMNLLKGKNLKKEGKYTKNSDFFRDIIYSYSFLSPQNRAEKIFKDKIESLNTAIKNNKVCNINIEKTEESKKIRKLRKIEPYKLLINPDDKFFYLIAYNYRHNKLTTFKLYDIIDIYGSNEDVKYKKKYLKKINELEEEGNFDPFLSYGEELIVKFTKWGWNQYNYVSYNRPKEKEEERIELPDSKGYICKLHCTAYHASIYFPNFFDKVEILGPLEVRKEFYENFRRSIKLYDKD